MSLSLAALNGLENKWNQNMQLKWYKRLKSPTLLELLIYQSGIATSSRLKGKILHCHQLQAKAVLWKTPCRHSKHNRYQWKHRSKTSPMSSHQRTNQSGFAVQVSWTFIQLFIQCVTTKIIAKELMKTLGLGLCVVYIATEQCFYRTVDEH